MAGYSATPLAKKLGFKPGSEVLVLNAPDNYHDLLHPLPDGVRFVSRLTRDTQIIHCFHTQRDPLKKMLGDYRNRMDPDAMLWVSWPKKSSGVTSEITEDTVRELALPLGLVDVKVCAVDETWSALKLVIRKHLR